MAARDLVFDIFAVDRASATFSRVGVEADRMGSKVSSAGKLASEGLLVAGAVAVGFGVKAVKMAGDFDAAITRLATTAGESQDNLKMVGNGLLDMAGKVGYSAQELAVGMYTVESAGYHGAAGLKVMEAAAKGARVEGADLTAVTDAVSSLLVDYHLNADKAAMVTNTLTAAVGHGKTTFEQMATALPNVAAAGASAKISMSELASAIATMTMHGTDAAKAGTYLRQVIGQLEAPSTKARDVMHSLGIDANQLGLTLSSGSGHGLADAIQMVDSAITKHLTPSGLVALEQFKKSKDATSAYQKVLADLPPTYVTAFGALSNMVGGVKSLQGFLQLGGENLKTYRSNVAAVNEQVRKGGNDVEGYAQQQATLNGKIADAKGAWSALAVEIGHNLTPAAKALVGVFASIATALSHHTTAVTGAIVVTAALATGLLAVKAATAAAAVTTALLGGAEVTLALRMAAGAAVTGDMTGAMAALSIAMDANPIGVVVLALAALVTGFILAWKHSETFREIAVAALKFVADAFLSMAGIIIHGAAFAFGWIPGIGPKLHAAAGWFDNFASHVNHTLDGINDRNVKVTAHVYGMSAVQGLIQSISAVHNKDVTVTAHNHTVGGLPALLTPAPLGKHATGGLIAGAGTGTSDSIPALLSNGEFVVNAAATKRNRLLLEALNAQRFASGGPVGFGPWNIHNPFQSTPGGATSGWHGAVWPSSPWGPLHASTQALNAAIKSTSASLKDHTKTLAADKTALSNLQAAASSLRDAVQGQFTGTNFNAGVAADPSTGQAYVSDLQAQEQTMFTNRVTSDRFLTDLKALKKLGISGPAFLQLAQSNDVSLLDQLVEGGRSEVAHYNSLLAQQNASATRVGNYAPVAAGYSADIKAQAATNKELAASIKLLNAELARLRKDLPKHVEAGAHAGAASGTHAGITGKAKTAQGTARNRPKGA